jgi:hypothetical protein
VTDRLIAFAVAGVLFLVIAAAIKIFLARRASRSSSAFSADRLRLLQAAAKQTGTESVVNPEEAGLPYLKSRPPDPPYGLALAPTSETSDHYFPVFEAPLDGGVFLEVWPAGSAYAPLRVNMGGGGLSVGDRTFDSAYVVRSDDPHFARSVLDARARGLIDEARLLGAGGRVRFNVDSVRLRIRKEEALSSAGDLAALIRIGRGLLERVRDAVESRNAVQYFDAPPGPEAKPRCPMCAGEVSDRRVACRRCRTSHHRECWEYAGGCSMFACGESRFSL